MKTTIDRGSTTLFQQVYHFEKAHQDWNPGRQLKKIKAAVPEFKDWFKMTGKALSYHSFDLITIPYPTKFGLWRAGTSPAPFLWFTNRMYIVQWRVDGRTWTLLNEPSETDLGSETPFYSSLMQKYGEYLTHNVLSKLHGTVESHLEEIGLKPEDIDFITYDHLHTQDIRRWVGTTKPQPDISPNEPVTPYFPNAKLIVQQKEWDILPHLHPMQRVWYQPEKYIDIPEERLLFIEGDVLLGPGVLLMWTPGHTQGNHSLVVNTDTGIWVTSENGIAAECYAPEASRIPGLKKYARKTGFEVVLNANVIEGTARQYNSMVQEKLVADPSVEDPRIPQFFPSSELCPNILSPGTTPSFMHEQVAFGKIELPGEGQ